jgi:capsular exopolysaccharide synthesis family protein
MILKILKLVCVAETQLRIHDLPSRAIVVGEETREPRKKVGPAVDFRTFVQIIAVRWKIVVAAILLCLLGAAAITAVQTKGYQASATVLMSISDASTVADVFQATQTSQLRLSSYAEIAGSPTVAQRAIDSLHVPMTADQLIKKTKISYTPESLLFRITVSDSNPQRVAALAGAMADQFVATVPQLDQSASGWVPGPSASATVVERPGVPDVPIRPVPARNFAQGLVAGLLLGIALALIRHTTDRTVRTRETLDRVSGVPMLAALPRSGGSFNSPLSDDAVRNLRTRLLAQAGSGPRSVLMTSPVIDEGASTTALKLALSFTELNEKAVLVEGDPRRPTIAGMVHVQSDIGLADVLAERSALDEAIKATGHTDLSIVASNESIGPEWHFGTAVLARTLEKLCARFDWVFIDGPPALVNADAGMLAGAVEATVLMVRAGKTTVDEVAAAIETLRAVGGNVVGTVLIDAPVSRQLRTAAAAYRAKVSEAP